MTAAEPLWNRAQLEILAGGKVYLRILSNLADRRCVRVRGRWAPS